jgi:hypothetical protein
MCVCTPLEVLQCYNLGKTEGFSASKCYKWATKLLQGATDRVYSPILPPMVLSCSRNASSMPHRRRLCVSALKRLRTPDTVETT